MKKQSKKTVKRVEKKRNEILSELVKYDLTSYVDDIEIMASMFNISKSRKMWIETARCELQMNCNKYEKIFGKYLLGRHIKFIHQAPFIVFNKIYFADFYLPDHKLVIEIDGDYHNSLTQKDMDNYRTLDLSWLGLKVIRIKNSIVQDRRLLDTRIKLLNI